MITLGIDVGTTNVKVLAFDTGSGDTLGLESAPTPVHSDAGSTSHRAGEVLELVVDLSARVVRGLPADAGIGALSVASVGEEVVLLDAASRPIGDTTTWYDPRGLGEAAAFLAGPGGDLALSRRWPPDPTFSLFKLLWTRDHEVEQLRAATTWTDLGDFVLHGLGGELVMDWSHASRAGAFDIVDRAWDSETIAAAKLGLAFPRLVPSGTEIGRIDPAVAARIGLPPEVVIVSGGHDHLCAAFGAGLRSTRELFLSAGTSEAHLALIDQPLEGELAGGVDQGCYVDDHSWYAHVNIHSGHFFRQWRDLLYAGVDDELMYAEVEAADCAEVRFDVTADMRSGRFEGVPYDADRAVMMRAVLEGLARRSATIVEQLEGAVGAPYELVLAAGHPTRARLWRELRMAAYARPMAAVTEPETTAFGAALLAAHALVGTDAQRLAAGRERWD